MTISSLSGSSGISLYNYNDDIAQLEKQKMNAQKDLQALSQGSADDKTTQQKIGILQQKIMQIEIQISRMKAERSQRQNSTNTVSNSAAGFTSDNIQAYSSKNATSRTPTSSRIDIRI